jgi:D-serine deaminase-like pyridoxal phosphate-dependent protein
MSTSGPGAAAPGEVRGAPPGSVGELPTPALVVDLAALDRNLAVMAAARPGSRCRPHVKAHKTSELARRQAAIHPGLTCATPREALGLAAVGLGHDLLVANETVDVTRLRALADCDARVTVAVDSPETVAAAASAGLREVVVDVNVGLPRCGCRPDDAGGLADRARAAGLAVRGVMGYEGHVYLFADREERRAATATAMELLVAAHEQVGGDVVSAGATGTYDLNEQATEIQAGTYALMDTQYAPLLPEFAPALWVEATVISVSERYAVADCGLKALGMDHGPPGMADADVLLVSDEHVTFRPHDQVRVGDRVQVRPAHLDPTVAYHAQMFVAAGDAVIDVWPVDLRGW